MNKLTEPDNAILAEIYQSPMCMTDWRLAFSAKPFPTTHFLSPEYPTSIIVRGVYCKSEYSPGKKDGRVQLLVLEKTFIDVPTWILADEPKKLIDEKAGIICEISGLLHPLLIETQVSFRIDISEGCAVYFVGSLVRPIS